MSARGDLTCSGCGQFVPSGVCLGPHAGYDPSLALGGPPARLMLRVTGEWRPLGGQPAPVRVCIECGLRFTPPWQWGSYSRRVTCGEECHHARLRRSQEKLVAHNRARRAA